jgi:hypothetical protein
MLSGTLCIMFNNIFAFICLCYENALVFVRVRVLLMASIEMTVIGDVAPCSLVETDRRFRGRPDDEGSKHSMLAFSYHPLNLH